MSQDPIFNRIINEITQNYSFRQQLIQKIQEKMDLKLIVYLSNPGHPWAMITRDDYPFFEELLRTISGDKVALMINSLGGDPNAAEKIIHMIRSHFKEFYVIVPNFAKSAATMIALGSDKIYMSHISELGPIDPQIQILTPEGRPETIPARAIINGLEDIKKRVQEDGEPIQIYLPLLSKLRPEIIRICEESMDEAEEFAKKWLTKYMFNGNEEKAKEVAKLLIRGERYRSHGKVINFQEARDVLGLNVEFIEHTDELWDLIWELYLRGEQYLRNTDQTKLFENEKVSLAMKVGIKRIKTKNGED